jgi:leader peptidase (prepilin peptidase) / N-methyltransferase
MRGAELLFDFWAFCLGAIVGSFANVCIYRLPKDESIVSPGSHCPSCGHAIAFYDNVPILSWLLLRARCRRCGWSIPVRYPAVEATVGLLFLGAAVRFGPDPRAVLAGLLAAASVILIATDLESRVLPDEITLGTLALALIVAAARDLLAHASGSGFAAPTLAMAAAGAASGAAILLLVRWAFHIARGVEGMGLGDVKMIAMIGAIVGPVGVLLTLFFASLSGSLLGGLLVLVRRMRWLGARRRAGQSVQAARLESQRHGLLVDAKGDLQSCGERWSEIPGAAAVGESIFRSGPVARPLTAVIRLALRRARAGRPTEKGRVFLDDGGEFFRVLAVRAEDLGGELFVLISRADIPFGVFLALGSLVAFVFGRETISILFGYIELPGLELLP